MGLIVSNYVKHTTLGGMEVVLAHILQAEGISEKDYEIRTLQ